MMTNGLGLSSNSVKLLLEAGDGSSDPEEVVRQKARLLIKRALDLGWTGPPFNVADLAGLQDIRVDYEPASRVEDAMLVADPETGQFTIKIGMGMPNERQRFNIGHEITHTFFPDCAETVQLRGGRPTFSADREVEGLCDIGAAEMLFPLDHFVRDAALLGGPSLRALFELRELYQASWEATANRLISTAESDSTMVVLEFRLKPTQVRDRFLPGLEPRPKLRVNYAVSSNPNQHGYIPKHKSVNSSSTLYRLLDDEALSISGCETEDWSYLGLGLVTIEGMRLPTEGDEVKLLVLTRPVSS